MACLVVFTDLLRGFRRGGLMGGLKGVGTGTLGLQQFRAIAIIENLRVGDNNKMLGVASASPPVAPSPSASATTLEIVPRFHGAATESFARHSPEHVIWSHTAPTVAAVPERTLGLRCDLQFQNHFSVGNE